MPVLKIRKKYTNLPSIVTSTFKQGDNFANKKTQVSDLEIMPSARMLLVRPISYRFQ